MNNKTLSVLTVAFASGIVFAFGLIISGMINPAKILNFLDIYGTWDATLLFVMLGSLLVTIPAYKLLSEIPAPLFEKQFHIPENQIIDLRLVGGSALFGVGWGLGGLCPGPSITALASEQWQVVLFVLAMLAGAFIGKKIVSS